MHQRPQHQGGDGGDGEAGENLRRHRQAPQRPRSRAVARVPVRAATHDGETDRAEPDQQRHRSDVGELQHAVEPVDVGAHGELDVAQLAADAQHLRAELLDRLAVLVGEDDVAALTLLLEAGELLLRLLELGLERQLLLAELLLGVAADVVDDLERTGLDAAPAQVAQRLAAGQVLDRIDDEHGVLRQRDLDLLAEELPRVDPELVVQEVGVGDDDGVELAGGQRCGVRFGCRRPSPRRLLAGRLVTRFVLVGLSPSFFGSSGFGRAAGERGLDVAGRRDRRRPGAACRPCTRAAGRADRASG